MKVSVVLTVYNKPRWLKQSIDSVLMQLYDDYEVLIMEDNSPDPMIKQILKTYEDHPRCKIWYSDVSEEDRYKTARYATLINKAVNEFSTGDLITYLTDDDYYYMYRLARMTNRLDQGDAEVVYGAQHIVDADGNVSGYRKTSGILSKAWDVVDHNSVMHTKEAFLTVGGWDDDPGTWGGADAHFWRRLNDAGYIFYPLEDDIPNECKRYHEDSIQWKMSNNVFFPKDRD